MNRCTVFIQSPESTIYGLLGINLCPLSKVILTAQRFPNRSSWCVRNRYSSSVSWSLYNNHRTDTHHLIHGPSTTTTEQIPIICVMVPLQQPQNRYPSAVMVPLQQPHNRYPSSVSWSLYNNHITDTHHLCHGPSTTTTEQILLICIMVPI